MLSDAPGRHSARLPASCPLASPAPEASILDPPLTPVVLVLLLVALVALLLVVALGLGCGLGRRRRAGTPFPPLSLTAMSMPWFLKQGTNGTDGTHWSIFRPPRPSSFVEAEAMARGCRDFEEG